ncbi:hypothetical protein F0H41_15630 [Vibrio cholerae]|uniref:aldo/keto reductase n=5 Tax=Vibrio cholerae TaxID=666 RepID=UPI0011F205D4|nr:aldo/keto reductase [Vibrio cholerae]EGR0794255.1 hypothetical protein [Vibrio cholerae]EGR0808070.1 hypothetical protein [Vibrio cholerae]EGR0811721.1 hypothetical protein [Vibrio cholerae]EGR3865815.1 hypothetical protein [Vibrio cholerae]EGR3950821.1 hypothetical protein [Vibrio cholerae]
MSKRICLGTAMWGWSVKEIVALNILDRFYESGGRYIDTAYNYPINGEKSKLTYSAKLVSRWIKKSGVNDLKIFFKIGSVTNEKIDTVNLSRENITKMTSLSEELFDCNLYSLMIHWDNREHLSEIKNTLIHLSESCEKKKVRLGLSGIRSTGLYQEIINGMNGLHIDQQVKSSFLSHNTDSVVSDREIDFRLWAYGISGSGLKLDKSEYRNDSYVRLVRPENYHEEMLSDEVSSKIKTRIRESNLVENLYQYAMLKKEQDKRYFGYLVSPSNINQLEQIISFKNRYDAFVKKNTNNI